MFGKKENKHISPIMTPDKKTTTSSNPSTGMHINSLGAGTKLEGTINSESDIRIDGELIGTLNCKGKVIIGPKGVVDGNIDCNQAVVEGHFKGVLKTSEMLNVTESAVIDGEVSTARLAVHPGAKFNVHCMTGASQIANNQKAKPEKILSFAKN